MTERTPELPRLDWPAEFDPSLEIIESHEKGLYHKVVKPRRVNKPGRRLIYRSLAQSENIKRFGELPKNYLMEVDPFGWAGNHFHQRKVELFMPSDKLPLIVFLQHSETGDKDVVVLNRDSRQGTYIQYIIPPKVVHFIANPAGVEVPYEVQSNMSEEEALSTGDVIHFPIDALTFTLPPEIMVSQNLQSLLASSKSLK